MLTENQQFNLLLLDKCGYDLEKATKCQRFVMGSEHPCQSPAQHLNNDKMYDDGIYICYKDGANAPFDADLQKENIRGIGLVVGSHSLCIALRNAGEYTLTNKEDSTGGCRYIPDWDEARMDFNGMSNWEHIKKIGTDITLADGEYIPALGELMLIGIFKHAINEALEWANGELLEDDWYWSSTEASSTYAWLLHLGRMHQYGNTKTQSQRLVRPVSAFTLSNSPSL